MNIDRISNNPCGGRKATPYLRLMNELADRFEGLPEGMERYEIIRLLKSVGRQFGFTSTLINHLEYLINHTQEIDWTAGHNPLVFKSVSKMAVDMGVSERQVTERENSLHKLGAITWRDCGNHKRYGHRDMTGRIVDGFGINLAPLCSLLPALIKAHEEKLELADKWVKLKRQISYYRKQVKQLFLEIEDRALPLEGADEFIATSTAMIKRIRAATPITSLVDLLNILKAKLDAFKKILAACDISSEDLSSVDKQFWPRKTSARAAGLRSHKYYTYNTYLSKDKVRAFGETQKNIEPRQKCLEGLLGSAGKDRKKAGGIRSLGKVVNGQGYDRSVKVDPNSTGLQHIKVGNLLHAMSPVFKMYLRQHRNSFGWAEIVDTAGDVCGELGIKNPLWADACAILGRDVAAVAVLIIDVNVNHPTNPIKSPAAVLHKMIVNAQAGKLALHQSLFGILSRTKEGVIHG